MILLCLLLSILQYLKESAILKDFHSISRYRLILLFSLSRLKLYTYFEDSNYVYLVLEMCHNGEMSRYLKEWKKPFTEEEGECFIFMRLLTFKQIIINVLK